MALTWLEQLYEVDAERLNVKSPYRGELMEIVSRVDKFNQQFK